jgi:hypothetical protein
MKFDRNKKIRNLLIFTMIALGIGWIGVMADGILPEQEEKETLGIAIWFITSLIVVIALSSFFGHGWLYTDCSWKGNPYFTNMWDSSDFVLPGTWSLVKGEKIRPYRARICTLGKSYMHSFIIF